MDPDKLKLALAIISGRVTQENTPGFGASFFGVASHVGPWSAVVERAEAILFEALVNAGMSQKKTKVGLE